MYICFLLCLIFIIKSMTCNKSITLINIYVAKITFCSVNALSAGYLATFQHTTLSMPFNTLRL